MELHFEEDIPITTIGELKDQFYTASIYRQEELKQAFKRQRVALEPQRLILNPPGYGSRDAVIATDVYIAIYYKGFFVRIECGRSMEGPHKFELIYQIRAGCHIWLGVFPESFIFFDQKKVKENLRVGIRRKLFYCSKSTASETVELLRTPKPKQIELDSRNNTW